jgi:hypothetical protein
MSKQQPWKARIPLYEQVYATFTAPISRFDCGKKCAAHNGGTPVCCTTDHAVPIVDRAEWDILKERSDLWHPFKVRSAEDRDVVKDLHRECMAIECKGVRSCERDNRTMACRAFPFFPYIDRDGQILGLSVYWGFEDRCWVQSHLEIATKQFIRECLAAYEAVFAADKAEFDCNKDLSADMRRVFSRWNRIIPVITRDKRYYAVEPRTHVFRPARIEEYGRHGPYKNDAVQADAAD